MLTVNLPSGDKLEFSTPVQVKDVALKIGPGLAKATVAAYVDDMLVGTDFVLPGASRAGGQDEVMSPKMLDSKIPTSNQEPTLSGGEVSIRLITKKDPEALAIMRHSCAHIMARAVMRLYEGVELAFGPTVENGFYYDFAMPKPISEADFEAIEKEMAKIVKEDEPFERIEMSRDEAIKLLEGMGQKLKVEHLQTTLSDKDVVSFYRQGEFVDLCRGPHVPSAGFCASFKLMSVAGAYWKGDAKNQQLTRLYGTAFFDKKELAEYITRLEEAKKRDHRVLGKQLELFTIDQNVGPGLILWLPKGAKVRRILENFLVGELEKRGYQLVNTPVVGRVGLYKTSGHYPYYADSQFPPIAVDEDDLYLLRPMNCPHHIMVYQNRPRSYKELPLRLAEFGNVHRYEQSGELSGLTRVRGFTQDDAHIFCTEDQVEDEFRRCLEMTVFVLKTMGFTDYKVRLSFRDPASDKYVGDPANWDKAEAALKKVCESMNLPDLSIAQGEAAFYGPKADFIVTDCIGRQWQLGTVQLDYNLPSEQRFNLEYIGADNQPHRPVMIHRAPFGSFERFFGILIEHFAGAFPLWLAPEQVRILVVSQKFEEYGKQLEENLRQAGLRVTGDYDPEKIGAKIRKAQMEKIPYMLIIGQKEADANNLSVRCRVRGDLGAMTFDEFVAQAKKEVEEKTIVKAE